MRTALLVLLAVTLSSGPALAGNPLAHTFSIVARDPATGDFGVAVFVKVDYGPSGLKLVKRRTRHSPSSKTSSPARTTGRCYRS